jgi:transposase
MASYVGIDVAKDRLDVQTRPLAKRIAVANDEEGMVQLLEILSPLHTERLVLEASGGY